MSQDRELDRKIAAMQSIKKQLQSFTKPGIAFADIENKAQQLMKNEGVQPNFSTVPGYNWATCVMQNEELCHGIPSADKTVADGDIISIDTGVLYDGFHLDTSISFGVGTLGPEKTAFLEIGQRSLTKAINKVRAGASVYEVSAAMQRVVERAGYGAVYQLTGHGIGTELHMDPAIPCVAQRSDKRIKLKAGDTIAVEIMYALGDPRVVEGADGWTFSTADNSLSGMFEETVLVTQNGHQVLT